MEVILNQDIKELGKKGQKVNVAEGYARNFLLPRKLAVEVNAQAINEMKNRESSKQHKIDVEKAAANDAAKKLTGKIVRVTAKAGSGGRLFGSVTAKDVSEAIKEQFGLDVDKRKLVCPEMKNFGTYDCDVKLYSGITASIKVAIGE
ncbi:MAG: 50S ribosomal protein L9 [Oscillospiraceae bacterium]|nr:50S ribosomal protein L9 [Oscillospiraceae bacterium]MDD7355404.1 50S ribosomal protein L9 [Oscillospiraceae bacterium]MDY3938455.1 50S ribosomal protein L9 [Oscillospiraceae bacterium]